VFLRSVLGMGASLGLVSALTGCGGSMGSSASDLALTSIIPYGGSPKITFSTNEGAATTGSFGIEGGVAELVQGQGIFVLATYRSLVTNINSQASASRAVGTYDAVWSVVRTNPPGIPVLFGNPVGTTFTGILPEAGSNVLLTGQSGNIFRVQGAGVVTLRLTVHLQLADGSRRSKSFDVDLNVDPALQDTP
jgi:hypothetical protein